MLPLREFIENHSALSNPLFDSMVDSDPPAAFLVLFLNEMRIFCAASRNFANLADSLEQMGEHTASLAVRQIALSEADHAPQFDDMAFAILGDRGSTLAGEPNLDSTKWACRHFESRGWQGHENVGRSLGVLLAVELLAHRHIIPGEMKVFIESGRFSIDDPRMEYLAEHAGESGAEAEHERLVLDAILPLQDRYGRLMTLGAIDFLEDVGWWYLDLQKRLHESS